MAVLIMQCATTLPQRPQHPRDRPRRRLQNHRRHAIQIEPTGVQAAPLVTEIGTANVRSARNVRNVAEEVRAVVGSAIEKARPVV